MNLDMRKLLVVATKARGGMWSRYNIDDPNPCVIQSARSDDDEAPIIADVFDDDDADYIATFNPHVVTILIERARAAEHALSILERSRFIGKANVAAGVLKAAIPEWGAEQEIHADGSVCSEGCPICAAREGQS